MIPLYRTICKGTPSVAVQINAHSGTLRPMLILSMPVLLEQCLHLMVTLVDTFLAARCFGDDASYLAAIGLLAYTLWMVTSIFGTVAIGATALVARFVGAGEMHDASRTTNQAFLVGAVIAFVGTLAVWLGGEWFIFNAMNLRGDAGEHATRYLMIMVPFIPVIMLEQVGIASLRGAGDTVSGLCAMTIVNIVNAALSASLATGFGPMPHLGWAGLAVGTAIAHTVGAAIIVGLLICGRSGLRLSVKQMRPDGDLIRRLLNIGLPGGADIFVVVACQMWFLSIINSLGTVQAAAHGLAIRVEAFAYLPGVAFQVAAATLAGQYLGAGDTRKAKRAVWLACLLGGGIMCVSGVALFIYAGELTWAFLGSHQPETASLAEPLLRVIAFAMPPLAGSIILAGGLRGAGDTRVPLLITTLGFLLVRLPLAYYLALDQVTLPVLGWTIPCMDMGVMGAWYAMVADIYFRGILFYLRFEHGGWLQTRV